jgi:biopolymer transport protein TolR
MPPDDLDEGRRLTAAQRARIRRAATPKGDGQEEGQGELNVVPFLDIITNVMMFVLASVAITFTVVIAVKAPAGRPHGFEEQKKESLELVVLVLRDGYFLKTNTASIAPGCEGTCTGGTCSATVPRIAASSDESTDGSKFDAAALTTCARKLKDAFEREASALAPETQVMISADPNVPFQEVVRAMDALRTDGRGPLFPEIVLGVWK